MLCLSLVGVGCCYYRDVLLLVIGACYALRVTGVACRLACDLIVASAIGLCCVFVACLLVCVVFVFCRCWSLSVVCVSLVLFGFVVADC